MTNAKHGHNFSVSQVNRLTSLSYKNLTMSESYLNPAQSYNFLSTNQTKRQERRAQKQQKISRLKKKIIEDKARLEVEEND